MNYKNKFLVLGIIALSSVITAHGAEAVNEVSVTEEDTTTLEVTTTKPKPNFDFFPNPRPEFAEQPASKRRKVEKSVKLPKIKVSSEGIQIQECEPSDGIQIQECEPSDGIQICECEPFIYLTEEEKIEKQNLYKANRIMAEKEILQLQEKLYRAKKAAHEIYMETPNEIVNKFVEIGYYEGSCYSSIELDPVLVLNPTLLNTIDF